MRSFQFTVTPVENGYRLRVKYGDEEYIWPDIYTTLEQVGKDILQALTTASESRGEEKCLGLKLNATACQSLQRPSK
jgi:hypothetical protein